ncbi:MAG TPA: hypothetical protein VGD63_11740 [Steroidobacteraceae bacterium]
MSTRELHFAGFGLLAGALALISLCARGAERLPSLLSAPEERQALESLLHQEFDASAAAMRDRLERDTRGDFVGAAMAAHVLEEHRARYLDLKREIARRFKNQASPPEAAQRDPFAPSFENRVLAPAAKRAPSTLRNTWDMYARRVPTQRGGNNDLVVPQGARALAPALIPWGMYGAAVHAKAVAAAISTTSESATPVKPYFVYRSP